MTSLLLSVPPEILKNIIANIDTKSTVASLACTSKALGAFDVPQLYRDVRMSHWLSDEITPIGSRTRFVAFIETVLTSNELASLVKVFHVADRRKAIEHPIAIRNHLLKVAPDNRLLRALCEICDKGGPTDWHQAIYVLVLLMLSRLRTLSFYDAIGLCDNFGQDFYEKVTSSLDWPHWEDLKTVSLRNAFRRLEPGQSYLETLQLGCLSDLDEAHLDALLRAPKALKGFCYALAGPMGEGTVTYRPHAIQATIEHQRDSLEELSLYTGRGYLFNDESIRSESESILPMTFKAFTQLDTLQMSLPFLFGAEVLRFENVHYSHYPVRRHTLPHENDGPTTEEQQRSKTRLVEMLPTSIQTVRFARCGDECASRLLAGAITQVVEQRDEFPKLREIEMHVWRQVQRRSADSWPSPYAVGKTVFFDMSRFYGPRGLQLYIGVEMESAGLDKDFIW